MIKYETFQFDFKAIRYLSYLMSNLLIIEVQSLTIVKITNIDTIIIAHVQLLLDKRTVVEQQLHFVGHW